MIGASTIISPILKVATTAAILGAIYLFILKPALDTTEDIARTTGSQSSEIQQQVQDSIREATGGAATTIQIPDIDVSVPTDPEDAQKLGQCVSRVAPNVSRIQRCMERFAP